MMTDDADDDMANDRRPAWLSWEYWTQLVI